MKKLWQIVLGAVLITAAASGASLSSYHGSWLGRGGIKEVKITTIYGAPTVEVYGKCASSACSWGKARLIPYGPSVSSNIARNTVALSAIYRKRFADRLLIIRKIGSIRIRVDVFTRFKDRSGRANYHKRYILRRSELGEPLEFLRQISPANNKVFNHYPRVTTLVWTPMSHVDHYVVEIDCLHCCRANRWCYSVRGRPWKRVNVHSTSYTFEWVGAQKGRWRVWAVLKNGGRSPKTPWRYFRYTR